MCSRHKNDFSMGLPARQSLLPTASRSNNVVINNIHKIAARMDASSFIQLANTNVNIGFQQQSVLPGDQITAIIAQKTGVVKLGIGLDYGGSSSSSSSSSSRVSSKETVRCLQAGTLKYKAPSTYFVETTKRLYIPKVGDQVVGIVEEKLSEFYKVNIFSSASALLGKLSFEGATKRNKPELKKGDVVYVRVVVAHKDMDCEVTCLSSTGVKKEWSTGETVYGGLNEGLVVKLPVGTARAMLLPDCVVLNALGKHYAYEVAVGMNGAIWLKAAEVMETIVIRNVLLNSVMLDDVQIEAMVETLAMRTKGNG